MTRSELKNQIKSLSEGPGVYLMYNAKGTLIYVGKAKNLQRRVGQYFGKHHTDEKTHAMVAEIDHFKVTLTRSESEALLLENQLIKAHRPRYNIIFKDDKSYPYLYLNLEHQFPALTVYRGSRKEIGRSFGPYPSIASSRETLALLQKLFTLRNCTESFFRHRSRPCLQYQLHRCSAPCVGKIDEKTYAESVKQTQLFLDGKSSEILKTLANQMEEASEKLAFERAAILRDQIRQLQQLQSSQVILTGGKLHADIVALAQNPQMVCVAVLMVRSGQVVGTKPFFPSVPAEVAEEEILSAFLTQYPSSPEVAIYFSSNFSKEKKDEIQSWMPENIRIHAGKKGLSGTFLKWFEMAKLNAEEALISRSSEIRLYQERCEAFQKTFHLSSFDYAVCFDVSHSLGESAVASSVVFEATGPIKRRYRQFKVEETGDDYAALASAVSRYFSRLIRESKPFPSLLLIDGGKGQLSVVQKALSIFSLPNALLILGISKPAFRLAGFEQIWVAGQSAPNILDPSDPALHFLQALRDEAHRFALNQHQKNRRKTRVTSILEQIPGIGKRRRQQLLHHFGSLDDIREATVEALAKAPGISVELAKKIHRNFRK